MLILINKNEDVNTDEVETVNQNKRGEVVEVTCDIDDKNNAVKFE